MHESLLSFLRAPQVPVGILATAPAAIPARALRRAVQRTTWNKRGPKQSAASTARLQQRIRSRRAGIAKPACGTGSSFLGFVCNHDLECPALVHWLADACAGPRWPPQVCGLLGWSAWPGWQLLSFLSRPKLGSTHTFMPWIALSVKRWRIAISVVIWHAACLQATSSASIGQGLFLIVPRA